MGISLSPKVEQLLEEKVKSGAYPSADEVVRAALHALDEVESQSLDEETLEAIDRAEAQIDRGEVHDWKDVRERVRGAFLGEQS